MVFLLPLPPPHSTRSNASPFKKCLFDCRDLFETDGHLNTQSHPISPRLSYIFSYHGRCRRNDGGQDEEGFTKRGKNIWRINRFFLTAPLWLPLPLFLSLVSFPQVLFLHTFIEWICTIITSSGQYIDFSPSLALLHFPCLDSNVIIVIVIVIIVIIIIVIIIIVNLHSLAIDKPHPNGFETPLVHPPSLSRTWLWL